MYAKENFFLLASREVRDTSKKNSEHEQNVLIKLIN
jgi:hypothetical protein